MKVEAGAIRKSCTDRRGCNVPQREKSGMLQAGLATKGRKNFRGYEANLPRAYRRKGDISVVPEPLCLFVAKLPKPAPLGFFAAHLPKPELSARPRGRPA